MLTATLDKVRCPRRGCLSPLKPVGKNTRIENGDILSGLLECTRCRRSYPILAGVAILVPDPREYVLSHVKGISRIVPEREIPRDWLDDYREARAELEEEHIEEDLESARVTSLYIMNHYLRADGPTAWWRPRSGVFSPEMEELIQKFWDRGPLDQIAGVIEQEQGAATALSLGPEATPERRSGPEATPELGSGQQATPERRSGNQATPELGSGQQAVELGCGVGGLSLRLRGKVSRYLGVDGSFASIALARHLALGCPYPEKIRFPEDLLHGTVSRELPLPTGAARHAGDKFDFVVGSLEEAPIGTEEWDLAVVLNAIDMLEKPWELPKLQARALRPGGLAIQSCPYIWHDTVATRLRGRLPKTVRDSAAAVEWLYEQEGLKPGTRLDALPWLFFKHVRQLELYSVHLFAARKLKA